MSSPRKIFFRRLPFKYTELDHRRPIRIFLTNSQKKDEQREVQFYAKKSSNVGEFLAEVQQWLPNLRSNDQSGNFRLIEVSLANQINPLPFHLHIWSNRSSMDELENCSNRYYHLEEISPEEIDLGKDAELIPVAHYTKVMCRRKFFDRELLVPRKMLFKSICKNSFHFCSKWFTYVSSLIACWDFFIDGSLASV